MKTEIEQRQTNRFIVLLETYNASKANTSVNINIAELSANKDVKNGVFKEAISFLKEEGLISKMGQNTGSITHGGVKLVEYIITHPDDSTDLFPSYKDMGI